jgi:hypothetical protein
MNDILYGILGLPQEGGLDGGQMMPKTTGWQGLIPSMSGGNITEYSMGGVEGEPFMPMVTQNMTPEMIQNIQLLESGLLSPDSEAAMQLRANAQREYERLMKEQGTAFKDYN